jgi:hypothetical protein
MKGFPLAKVRIMDEPESPIMTILGDVFDKTEQAPPRFPRKTSLGKASMTGAAFAKGITLPMDLWVITNHERIDTDGFG